MHIPLNVYHFIESDQKTAQVIKLPQIFVKSGTFAHLKLAVQWMANLLSALRQGEECVSHQHLFVTGLEMADCIIRNLSSV